MRPYADTNFITHLYLERRESGTAQGVLSAASGRHSLRLPATWLVRAETLNAIEQSVFAGRAMDHPRFTPEQAAAAQACFAEDWRQGAWLETCDLPLAEMLLKFEELALRHTARRGFRAYDVLHVASALTLRCDTFWSFDTKALKLAKLEGLKTI